MQQFEPQVISVSTIFLCKKCRLTSVQPDEMIMVSLNISIRSDDIPGAVHLAIKKEEINQYQRGDLTREQAMAKISQREE